MHSVLVKLQNALQCRALRAATWTWVLNVTVSQQLTSDVGSNWDIDPNHLTPHDIALFFKSKTSHSSFSLLNFLPLQFGCVCFPAAFFFFFSLDMYCSLIFLCPPLLPLCRGLIEKDVTIPPETFRKHVDSSMTYINQALKKMSRLFLVEDLVDSLKVSSQRLRDGSLVDL